MTKTIIGIIASIIGIGVAIYLSYLHGTIYRKEKGLTQEKAAEQFQVSRRTVSRWETGSNLPDLDILIEMADYFEVDLREAKYQMPGIW